MKINRTDLNKIGIWPVVKRPEETKLTTTQIVISILGSGALLTYAIILIHLVNALKDN